MQSQIRLINELAKFIPRDVNIMEVCGGHTNTIIRKGIRDAMPSNIRLISGPGCPVCVTTQREIDEMIGLALNGVPVATYADMLRVPGTVMSLEEAREDGANVKSLYSVNELLKTDDKETVFFGIGFETTTPMTARLLKAKLPVYSAHKLIPPGLDALSADPRVKIDGLILPGHVSTIIGSDAYTDLKIPQVIAGFEPENVVDSIRLIVEQVKDNKGSVVNNYSALVRPSGNPIARRMISDEFRIVDSEWRGLGVIPKSGLEVMNDELNARIIHENIIKKTVSKELPGCRCAEVVIGSIVPQECALFGKACTPKNPRGACMVSEEGACQINFNSGR